MGYVQQPLHRKGLGKEGRVVVEGRGKKTAPPRVPSATSTSSDTPAYDDPSVHYFLANMCDLRVAPEKRVRLGVRYPLSKDVRKLLQRIQEGRPLPRNALSPNALLSALKEILGSFPGGVWGELAEEFFRISLHSPLNITLVYLHGVLETLPPFRRQFVYLVCRSLRNMVGQCAGGQVSSYTDLLVSFTPVLFPSALGDLQRYLRAARLTLVMIDCVAEVFQPFVWLDHNVNAWQQLGDDEAFLYQILGQLQRLQCSLDCEDENPGEEEKMADEEPPTPSPATHPPPRTSFYQVVYLDNTDKS